MKEPTPESDSDKALSREQVLKCRTLLLSGLWQSVELVLRLADTLGTTPKDWKAIFTVPVFQVFMKSEDSRLIGAWVNQVQPILGVPSKTRLEKILTKTSILDDLSIKAATYLAGFLDSEESGNYPTLNFIGLKSINHNVARILSSCVKPYSLLIGGIEKVDDQTALALSTHCGSISLWKLNDYSEKAAIHLSKLSDFNFLQGIEDPSPDFLRQVIALHPYSHLEFSGIKNLSSESAKVLVTHRGKIGLSNLKQINPDAAHFLSRYQGDLDLSGLQNLTPDVAEGLAPHRFKLNLNGLDSMELATARHLREHAGRSIQLDALTQLNEASTLELMKYKGTLSLDSLPFDSHLHFSLVARKSRLNQNRLRDLVNLTDEMADELVHAKGNLSLQSVQEISVHAAECLGKRAWSLTLGIHSISAEIAEQLSQHRGQEMYLPNLSSIDDKSAKFLSHYRGKYLGLQGVASLSVDAAKALANFQGEGLYLHNLQPDDEILEALGGFGGNLHCRPMDTKPIFYAKPTP